MREIHYTLVLKTDGDEESYIQYQVEDAIQYLLEDADNMSNSDGEDWSLELFEKEIE